MLAMGQVDQRGGTRANVCAAEPAVARRACIGAPESRDRAVALDRSDTMSPSFAMATLDFQAPLAQAFSQAPLQNSLNFPNAHPWQLSGSFES